MLVLLGSGLPSGGSTVRTRITTSSIVKCYVDVNWIVLVRNLAVSFTCAGEMFDHIKPKNLALCKSIKTA